MAELSFSFAESKQLLTLDDTAWVIKAHNPGMKRILESKANLISHIHFLPVIEGDPNDLNTIFTTLEECIRVSGNSIAVVTFDLLIWLKATDIIKQAYLSIIARLGGLHLLMSYLGSIRNIMQDSGLLET